MTPAANLVDAASPGRVLVFGSPPRSGCDLDLLVRKDELTPIAQALAGAGFRSRDQEWVRFRESTAEAVDLVPATDWSLPQHELDDLFARARPLDGFERLVAPSPEHVLLVLARITGGSGLSPKRRGRIDGALADEPEAWRLARARAAAWGLRSELDRLERAYRGEPAGRPRLPRPRRPRVVALSGIDGSGKSSQARALRAALEQLGHETAVEWSPYGQDA